MTPKKAYSYTRFSSKKQELGDSLRRQKELRDQWLKNNPEYELDDTLTMSDLGISAFRGTHIAKGALGAFLKKIKEGDIEKESSLLIENMDRLSREKPTVALRMFDEIIQAGIKVVTLESGMEYTEDSLNQNPGQLFIIIGEIHRANAESNRKSIMIGKYRNEQRQNLRAGDITAIFKRVPMWIDKNSLGQKTPIKSIPEIARAINFIYDEYLEGEGKIAIMNTLNDPEANWWKPAKTITKTGRIKTGGWKHSTINRYLDDDRRLIGECQLYKQVNGKRVPDGDPIPDIFPEVIPREKYFRVQQMKQRRSKKSGNAGGRADKFNNLFRHLVRCGVCGSNMMFDDKGNKGGLRLTCANKKAKAGCTAKNIPYNEFESIVRKNFRELDISQILPGGSEIENRIHSIRNAIDGKKGEITSLEQQIETLTTLISEPEPSNQGTLDRIYHKRNQAHAAKIDKLSKEIKELLQEENTLSNQTKQLKDQFAEVNDFQALLDQVETDEERREIRSKLNNTLQNMLDKIVVLPLRSREEAIDDLSSKIVALKAEIQQSKQTGEKRKGIPKGAVRLSALRNQLKELQGDDPEPGIELIMDSERIDRIDLYFSGAGIIEEDEDGETRIKHRAVRLTRRKFTEQFRP